MYAWYEQQTLHTSHPRVSKLLCATGVSFVAVFATSSDAVSLLQDEKKVLEGVTEWFSQRLKSLDGLEYYQERRLKGLGLMDDDGKTTFEDMVQINV